MNFSDTATGGSATVNVNDSGSTNSASGTLAFTSPNEEKVTGLGFGAGGSFSFNTGTPGTTTLNVSQGTNGPAGVATNVNSTPSTLSTTITGGANPNTFNIGGAAPGSLNNVVGAVSVVGGGATSAINLNDQSSSTNADYTVTSSAVTRPGTFGGLTYSGVGVLTLNAGTGTNLINVNSTAVGIVTNINGDGGGATINVNGTAALPGTLNVTTGASGGSTVNVLGDSELVTVTTNGVTPDTVNIGAADGTGNVTPITGPVTLTGNQLYVLAINDQGDASIQTYNIDITTIFGADSGTVALGASVPFLNFSPSNLTSLTFNGGSADGNAINFNGQTPNLVTTQINAGAGDDTTVLQGSGAGSTVNIDSQAGSNTMWIPPVAATMQFPGGAQQLLGVSVNVSDASGTTNLTIDDSQDTGVRGFGDA